MASRTLLWVAVAAAAGVLATTAATRSGTAAGASAAPVVPTGTARVINTTLTSRQQVNGTLGYSEPATLFAPHGADAELPLGVFTWLPAVGVTVGRGQRLYEVDGQPVPLLLGAQPLYRHLGPGATGADVRELEDNLLALGFGTSSGLVANGTFAAADAAAVRAWQTELGAPVTGTLDLGAAVMQANPVRIAALHASLGGTYAPGQPVLDVTDTAHVVTVQLDTALAAGVKVGDAVSVQLPGAGAPATGKVIAVSAAAQALTQQQGQGGPLRATLPVTIRLDDPAAGGALDQVPVRVSITDQVRRNVLAVPVTALVARSDGTFAVLVVRSSGRVPVTVRVGVFGDAGLVEVTGDGLAAGDLVEVPQSQ
ncbi:MAG TPA: peptidoglycan-binding protein [Candidatus Dormibacteraeota bacterium]